MTEKRHLTTDDLRQACSSIGLSGKTFDRLCDELTDTTIRDHGFQWIGQSFQHCEKCGKSAKEHAGMDVLKIGAGPFDRDSSEIVPWDEAFRRMPMAEYYGAAHVR